MPLYSVRSGVLNHPEDTFLQHLTDVVSAGGVISVSAGDYLASEPSGGGLNVDVAAGRGYVKKSGNAYPVRNTSTVTVPITANTSGNPRITTIVAVLDISAVPVDSDEGKDVHEIVAVNGTPASSPVAPDDGAIASAIGSSAPYFIIADVAVAHNASGISNTNITDRRRRAFFRTPSTMIPLAYTATLAHDYRLSNQVEMVLTGNLTINAPTNMEVGEWLYIRLTQDATGTRAISWSSDFTSKSADMTLATGAYKSTSYAIHKVSSTDFDAFLQGKDYL